MAICNIHTATASKSADTRAQAWSSYATGDLLTGDIIRKLKSLCKKKKNAEEHLGNTFSPP